jgi:hypothetical protein
MVPEKTSFAIDKWILLLFCLVMSLDSHPSNHAGLPVVDRFSKKAGRSIPTPSGETRTKGKKFRVLSFGILPAVTQLLICENAIDSIKLLEKSVAMNRETQDKVEASILGLRKLKTEIKERSLRDAKNHRKYYYASPT